MSAPGRIAHEHIALGIGAEPISACRWKRSTIRHGIKLRDIEAVEQAHHRQHSDALDPFGGHSQRSKPRYLVETGSTQDGE